MWRFQIATNLTPFTPSSFSKHLGDPLVATQIAKKKKKVFSSVQTWQTQWRSTRSLWKCKRVFLLTAKIQWVFSFWWLYNENITLDIRSPLILHWSVKYSHTLILWEVKGIIIGPSTPTADHKPSSNTFGLPVMSLCDSVKPQHLYRVTVNFHKTLQNLLVIILITALWNFKSKDLHAKTPQIGVF